MSRAFTRAEFYELVWSKPMTHLAKEFALSDVALHKICRKHDIPNPPLGWWAKKAAGKEVKRTPLPRVKQGTSDRITIAVGEIRKEPDHIAEARESARVLATTIEADADTHPHPIVDRTVAKLRKAKPSAINGLVSAEEAGLIKAAIAPASVDRLEIAFRRIAAAADTLGIKLVRDEKAASFVCDGETIRFSVNETVKREKHVLTESEKAQQEAWQRKQERRWTRGSWDDDGISWPRFPEWDYHATGQLSVEFDNGYLWGANPRRSFRDAKIQRIENMATDIAVGIAVLAAAIKEDRQRREEEARRQKELQRQRELAQRAEHVRERRGAALNSILDEIASLDRLTLLITSLSDRHASSTPTRVSELIAFAKQERDRRELALSADELANRFEKQRLFGDDDDHDFRPRYF